MNVWQVFIGVVGLSWSAYLFAATNINTADVQSLAQSLHGVGVEKAAAIVAHRNLNGPFQQVEDLIDVKGIGPAILEQNRQELVVSDEQVKQ